MEDYQAECEELLEDVEMGLQYQDFRSDDYAESYPNYKYIEDALCDAVE